MKTKITRGDVFISKLWSGEILRETLPNHAIRYHGLTEQIDKQRFQKFLKTPAAHRLSKSLDSYFNPFFN